MKKWIDPNGAKHDDNEVIKEFGSFLGGLLIRRGIFSLKAAEEFFGCRSLSDPLLMSDMGKAAEVIGKALETGKRITVFGDYDCDGVTSTVILYSYLEAQGADVSYYIPQRSEGYGMNIGALEKIIAEGAELIITVDNGIAAVEEAKFLKEKGVELVITDHHQPMPVLPECAACVDPHRADDPSPFVDLCGAGVVLKLLVAIEGDEDFIMDNYSDLACLGTIADMVPLKGENRLIVRRGLENIQNEQNMGLTALIKAAGLDPSTVTSTDLAFSAAPRINAAGRMVSADKAVRLLLCDGDPEEARAVAEELNDINKQRQTLQNTILSDVEKQIKSDPLILKQRVIIVSGEGWHPGIIGLAASNLTEKYGKPSIVITVSDNGEARGSVRSIEGFSVHKMLTECSEVFTKFGGHPGAGAFSLPSEKIGELTALINKYAKEYYPQMPDDALVPDMEVTAADLTVENVEKLKMVEPFGEGNRTPLLLLRNCMVKSKRSLKDGKYTSFEIESAGQVLRVISFKLPFSRFLANAGDKIDIIAVAEINEYKNTKSVQLRLVEQRPAGFREDRFFAALRVYESLCRREGCDSRLAPRVIPQSREELMHVYDMVKKYNGTMTAEEMAVYDGTVNYCMLCVTLNAFEQAKMIEYSEIGAPRIIPVKEKHDLFKEGILADLKKQFEK